MKAPPVMSASVKGRQQRKKRRTLPPTPPVKIRSVEPKGRTRPIKKKGRAPSSSRWITSEAGSLHWRMPCLSFGHLFLHIYSLRIKMDLPAEEKPSSDLPAASYGLSQPKEVPKPSWDTKHVRAWGNIRLPTPVYVRMDHSGVYHSYPDLKGGPFQSLDLIETAFLAHARGNSTDGPNETMEQKKERVIHESLEWSDGTRKVSTSLERAQREIDNVHRLVKALLDTKKDDDKNFNYELKDIVHWQSICEGPDAWYYHFNITMTTKGAADDASSANLFFAEAKLDQNNTPGYFLSSFCRIERKNRVFCHGCVNNGSTDMKHPTSHFDGGHVNTHFPLGYGPCNDKQCCDPRIKEGIEEQEELRIEEEQRIRESLDYLDDPHFPENIRNRRAEILALNSQIQKHEKWTGKTEE